MAFGFSGGLEAIKAPGANIDMIPSGMPPFNFGGGEKYKPGLGEMLDRLLFGGAFTEATDASRARHEAPKNAADLETLLTQVFGNDNRQRLTYKTAPTEWAKANAKNYEPATVNGGDTRSRPGYGDSTAPLYTMSGDSGVVLGPAGLQVLGQRPASKAEETSEADKAQARMIQLMLAQSTMADRRARQGIAQQRLDKPSGGGSSETPPWKRKW